MDNDVKEISKEIIKDVYNDAGKPVAKPTGELIGLVPRAIKAALSPLEKWIITKEYNIEETKKLLEEKLKNTPPESIQPPEPYIAVPTIQYLSYCMDNHELRNMYANLLANSMNNVVKDEVHPGFVEIIKQLSPDEAKILKYFALNNIVPTVSLNLISNQNGHSRIINNFSNVGELSHCEFPFEISVYFDNMIRLGLLESSSYAFLTDKKQYKPLKEHYFIKKIIDSIVIPHNFKGTDFEEGYMKITDFGLKFCEICVDKNDSHTFDNNTSEE